MELQFQVKNQRLYLNTVNQVVADSKNYLTAVFTFTDDWDGAVKVAQFTRGTTTTNVTIDASTGECVVPQFVLAGEGEFFVSVYGSINNEATIITANTIKIAVLPSGFIANPGTISQADAAALQAHADAVTAVTNSSTTGAGGYVHQIVFTVRNQSMYLTTRGKVVADSQGYLGAKFLFSDDWDDVIKIAQFKRDDLFFSIKLDANDECTVPWEVLVDEGVFIANVFGNNRPNQENKIITVNPVEVKVERSGLTAGELPSNPTMGIDGSVLYEITQYTERAEIAATTATNASADALASAQDAENSATSASASADTAASSAAAAANSATAAAASAATASNAAQTVENYASGFAPLTSPAFYGIPTAPTAMAGTNTNQIATTAFVQAELEDYATLLDLNDYVEVSSANYIKSAAVSGDTLTLTKGNDTTITYTPDIPTKVSDLTNDAGYATTTYTNTAIADAVAGLVDSAPATLDTLNELADALGNDPNFATTVATQIGTKAPLASPALTGTPTAPTPTADDNSTRIATTAYVQAELADFALTNDLGDYLPLSGGTLTGDLYMQSPTGKNVGFILTDVNPDNVNYRKNLDIGWDYNNRDGAGFYIRSVDWSGTEAGAFGAYARNATNSYDLRGLANGSLTWNGTSFTVGGGTGTITGNITGNVLTGYTKPSATSALAATDTLNGALGKLEKALDGKSDTSHNHTSITGNAATATSATNDADGNNIASTYAPKNSPAFTGTPTAPTPTATDNSTKLATTAWVNSFLANSKTTMRYIGVNPTNGKENDTKDFWKGKGTCFAYINALNQVNGQPWRWGFLINYVYTDEIHQIFLAQNYEGTYCRYANRNTTAMPMFEMVGCFENAGPHNGKYRGNSLGNTVTDEQWQEIKAGTFRGMYIGDYWTINSIQWRIAAFDYFYNTGDTSCTTHHVVIVPDTNLASCQMNSTAITTGAYIGSDFYTGNNNNVGRSTAINAVNNAFGSEHILTHREYLQNAVTNGYQSGSAWYDCTVELLNEHMVYGGKFFENACAGGIVPDVFSVSKSQLPLFAHEPSRITIRANWWLRSVVNATNFESVRYSGAASHFIASTPEGVRPYFAIYQA